MLHVSYRELLEGMAAYERQILSDSSSSLFSPVLSQLEPLNFGGEKLLQQVRKSAISFIHYVNTYICIHVHTYVCTYVHMYIRTYIHTYICIYVCVYLHQKQFISLCRLSTKAINIVHGPIRFSREH